MAEPLVEVRVQGLAGRERESARQTGEGGQPSLAEAPQESWALPTLGHLELGTLQRKQGPPSYVREPTVASWERYFLVLLGHAWCHFAFPSLSLSFNAFLLGRSGEGCKCGS